MSTERKLESDRQVLEGAQSCCSGSAAWLIFTVYQGSLVQHDRDNHKSTFHYIQRGNEYNPQDRKYHVTQLLREGRITQILFCFPLCY